MRTLSTLRTTALAAVILISAVACKAPPPVPMVLGPSFVVMESGALTTTSYVSDRIPVVTDSLAKAWGTSSDDLRSAPRARQDNPMIHITDAKTGERIVSAKAGDLDLYSSLRIGYDYLVAVDEFDRLPGVQQPFRCDYEMCVIALSSDPNAAVGAVTPTFLITRTGDLTVTSLPDIKRLWVFLDSVYQTRGEGFGDPTIRLYNGLTGEQFHEGSARGTIPELRLNNRYAVSIEGPNGELAEMQPFRCTTENCVVVVASDPKASDAASQELTSFGATTQPHLVITQRGELTTTEIRSVIQITAFSDSAHRARGKRAGNPIVRITDPATGTRIHSGHAHEPIPHIIVGRRYLVSVDRPDEKPGVQQPLRCDFDYCVVVVASDPKGPDAGRPSAATSSNNSH